MAVALPLTSLIAQGSSRKRTNRVLRAQLGDGYEQKAPNGINNIVDEWSIRYIVEQKTGHNSEFIQWQLTSIIDRFGMMLPRRQVLRDKGFPQGQSRSHTW